MRGLFFAMLFCAMLCYSMLCVLRVTFSGIFVAFSGLNVTVSTGGPAVSVSFMDIFPKLYERIPKALLSRSQSFGNKQGLRGKYFCLSVNFLTEIACYERCKKEGMSFLRHTLLA